MSLSWSNEETFKFIDLYQSEAIIWDPNNALHKDKKKVHEAWKRIADCLQVPISKLKKKKETLMTAFRMHFRKKQKSIRYGTGEEIYRPVWVFYEAMEAFLKKKYECIPAKRESNPLQEEEQSEISSDGSGNAEKKYHSVKKIPAQRRRRVRRPKLDKSEKEKSQDFNMSNQVMVNKDNNNQQDRIEDDCELYGRLLAKKLRKYSESERQDIMYEIDGLLLRRRRNCSPRYVPSPSQITVSKRQRSSGSNYSCPSPSSPYWINPPSSSNSSRNSHHEVKFPSGLEGTSPAQTPSPIPDILGVSSHTQERVYVSPIKVPSPAPKIPVPKDYMEIICNESYSKRKSGSQKIMPDAYFRAMDYKR